MAEEKLDIVVRMKDFATQEFSRLRSGVHGFAAGTVGAFKGITGAVFSLKGALVGLGVALSVRELVGMVNATADAADHLRDLSLQTGVSVEALSELKFAAELSGASVEDLEVGFRKAQKNLSEFARTAGGEAAEAAGLLGDDFKRAALQGASLESLLPLVSDGIKKLGASDRVLVASQLFGRGGAKLIPLLIDDMDALRARARELGVTLSGPAADAADAYNDALVELKGAFEGLKNAAILNILPELTDGIRFLADQIAKNRPVIIEFFASVIEGSGDLAKSVSEAAISIDQSIGVIGRSATRVEILKKAFEGAFTSTLGDPNKNFAQAQKDGKKLLDQAGELSDSLFEGVEQRQARLRAIGNAAESAAKAAGARLREVAQGIRDAGDAADFVGPKFEDAFEAIGPTLQDVGLDVEDLEERIKRAGEAAKIAAAAAERIDSARKKAAELAAEWEHVHSATMGAQDAFRELQEQSTQWGIATKDAILGVNNALASNTSDALLSVADGTKSVKAAFHDMARSIVKDIARIIIETLILKAVQAAVGGLGGAIFGSGAGAESISAAESGHSSNGSTLGPSYELSARTASLAPSRSLATRGVASGGASSKVQVLQTIVFNHHFTSPSDERQLFERNKKSVVDAVIEANNSSLRSREGLR